MSFGDVKGGDGDDGLGLDWPDSHEPQGLDFDFAGHGADGAAECGLDDGLQLPSESIRFSQDESALFLSAEEEAVGFDGLPGQQADGWKIEDDAQGPLDPDLFGPGEAFYGGPSFAMDETKSQILGRHGRSRPSLSLDTSFRVPGTPAERATGSNELKHFAASGFMPRSAHPPPMNDLIFSPTDSFDTFGDSPVEPPFSAIDSGYDGSPWPPPPAPLPEPSYACEHQQHHHHQKLPHDFMGYQSEPEPPSMMMIGGPGVDDGFMDSGINGMYPDPTCLPDSYFPPPPPPNPQPSPRRSYRPRNNMPQPPARTRPQRHAARAAVAAAAAAASSSSPTHDPLRPKSSTPIRKTRSSTHQQQQQQQQKSSSSAARKSASKSRSSGAGGGGGGMVDFVNFTPSDSGVLMTGVAPSGSSKTKARREREAMETRQRLNEAAVKAVKAAGGNVDKLMQEGFMM